MRSEKATADRPFDFALGGLFGDDNKNGNGKIARPFVRGSWPGFARTGSTRVLVVSAPRERNDADDDGSEEGSLEIRFESVSMDTNESLRIFLNQQLRDVEEDIETISSYISSNPPETTGELLKLRQLQRKYREIAASIENEIVKLG